MGSPSVYPFRFVVCDILQSLLDYGEEDESYLYLDPKLRERADPAAARARGPPREVIVFMIGGGCYSEYQNLQVRESVGGKYLDKTRYNMFRGHVTQPAG